MNKLTGYQVNLSKNEENSGLSELIHMLAC